MFYNDNDDSSIESINNSIIKIFLFQLILMNIQSRTTYEKGDILRKQ